MTQFETFRKEFIATVESVPGLFIVESTMQKLRDATEGDLVSDIGGECLTTAVLLDIAQEKYPDGDFFRNGGLTFGDIFKVAKVAKKPHLELVH